MKPKIIFFFLLFFALHLSLCALHSSANIPRLIGYQGRLTDSQGNPREGSHSVTFRIYDAESGGSLLWNETHSNVTVTNGIFDVLLGSVTPLDLAFDKQYYLAIQVGDDPEMTPRQRIASAGYAFRAEHGVPKGVITMWSGKISDIPSGWALCDGTNGTPDLRDKFIVGAKQDDAGVAKTDLTGSLTQNGGSVNIATANLPSHTHNSGTLVANSGGEHNHSLPIQVHTSSGSYAVGSGGGPSLTTGSGGDHSHSITGSTSSTGSGTAYAQPYYALAFIMKIN